MASNMRRGLIPYKTTGLGQYVDEIYSLQGFFGEWAHMYRRNNLAHPVSWSDERLMYSGLDPAQLIAPDRADARGEPLRLLEGDGVAVSLSQRSQPMPFAEKNVDFHQIRFYHRGGFLLETELGPLAVEAGDFVVIPRGLIYRERPNAPDGNCVYVIEVEAPIQLAEKLWDSVGYASLFVDYSEMGVPDPSAAPGVPDPSAAPGVPDPSAASAGESPAPNPEAGGLEHELRVRYDGRWHSMTYDFDPCRDVIGWVGDPVIFKLNVWNVPTSGTTHGHLPPPSGAVLLGEDREFFFNVLSTPPPPTVPPPDGSFGPPSHLNDYDEVWLNHVSEAVPHTQGHLWLLPRTLPHPGIKRPTAPPMDGRPSRSMRINLDTKASLAWTPQAREALFEDPIVAKYTSFFGVPLKAAPEKVRKRAGL